MKDADTHCCLRKAPLCSLSLAEGRAGVLQGGEAVTPRTWQNRPHTGMPPSQYYEIAIRMLESMSSESTIGRLVRFWQKPEHVVLVGQKVELPQSLHGGMSAFAHCGLLAHVRQRSQERRSRWLQLDWFSEGLLCRRTQEEPAIKAELFRREVELDVPLSLLVAVLREVEHHSYGLLFWNCHHFAEHVWTELQQPANEGQGTT